MLEGKVKVIQLQIFIVLVGMNIERVLAILDLLKILGVSLNIQIIELDVPPVELIRELISLKMSLILKIPDLKWLGSQSQCPIVLLLIREHQANQVAQIQGLPR